MCNREHYTKLDADLFNNVFVPTLAVNVHIAESALLPWCMSKNSIVYYAVITIAVIVKFFYLMPALITYCTDYIL